MEIYLSNYLIIVIFVSYERGEKTSVGIMNLNYIQFFKYEIFPWWVQIIRIVKGTQLMIEIDLFVPISADFIHPFQENQYIFSPIKTCKHSAMTDGRPLLATLIFLEAWVSGVILFVVLVNSRFFFHFFFLDLWTCVKICDIRFFFEKY